MQIELIDTFLDLCETRSFNRSAERLGVTQSTVSGRIRTLETTLGRPLFVRSRAGTELTTEGLRFEPHARALRRSWAEALNATRDSGQGGVTLRIGIQHDLVGDHFADLIREFRQLLPDATFLFEADYSTQMCSDLVSGLQDIALLYSPRIHPDLYFETVGEIWYDMISTDAETLAGIGQDRYILGNYSPAFAATHAALHPNLGAATLSVGQNAAMTGLLRSLGGSAYVLRDAARALVATGAARAVGDATPIAQTVFAGLHLRQRHRTTHRHLLRYLRGHFDTVPQRSKRS
jgi:LysR family transcriptional regulator, flagellar master operon regulator